LLEGTVFCIVLVKLLADITIESWGRGAGLDVVTLQFGSILRVDAHLEKLDVRLEFFILLLQVHNHRVQEVYLALSCFLLLNNLF
jgi:hypothetical protein